LAWDFEEIELACAGYWPANFLENAGFLAITFTAG
jgi:hypothetical protein